MTQPVGYYSHPIYLPASPVSDEANTKVNQASNAIFIKTPQQSPSGSPLRISPSGSPLKEHDEHLMMQIKQLEEQRRQLEETLLETDTLVGSLSPNAKAAFEEERINNLDTCDLQAELDDVSRKINGYERSITITNHDLDYYNSCIQKDHEQVLTKAKATLVALKELQNPGALKEMEDLLAKLERSPTTIPEHLEQKRTELEQKKNDLEANLKELMSTKDILLARQKELSLKQDLPVSSILDQEIEFPQQIKNSAPVVIFLHASENEKSKMLEAMNQELTYLNSLLAKKRERLAKQETKEIEPIEIDNQTTFQHHFLDHVSPHRRNWVSEADIKNYEDRIKRVQNDLYILKAVADAPQHFA